VSSVFPIPRLAFCCINRLRQFRSHPRDRCCGTTTTVRGRNESEPNL
jgi:hypothetical protein